MRFLLLNVYWLIIWVNACTLFFAQYFCSSNKYIYLNIFEYFVESTNHVFQDFCQIGLFVSISDSETHTYTCLTVEWLPFSGYREYTRNALSKNKCWLR